MTDQDSIHLQFAETLFYIPPGGSNALAIKRLNPSDTSQVLLAISAESIVLTTDVDEYGEEFL